MNRIANKLAKVTSQIISDEIMNIVLQFLFDHQQFGHVINMLIRLTKVTEGCVEWSFSIVRNVLILKYVKHFGHFIWFLIVLNEIKWTLTCV